MCELARDENVLTIQDLFHLFVCEKYYFVSGKQLSLYSRLFRSPFYYNL